MGTSAWRLSHTPPPSSTKPSRRPRPVQLGAVAEDAVVRQILVDDVLLVVLARNGLHIQRAFGEAAQVVQRGFHIGRFR